MKKYLTGSRTNYHNLQKHTMSLLSISEKREWLARIFRDKTGEYTDADKFKAMEADNRLAMLQYAADRNKDVTVQDVDRKCSDCTFYFKDSSDTISPGCASCALGQNPTEVPCGHYSKKKDNLKESASKRIVKKDNLKESASKRLVNKEDESDINIPWAMETFLGLT